MNEDDEPELIPYNIVQVSKVVSVDEDGVATSVVLHLACDEHPMEQFILLHPRTAMLTAVELLNVAVES